MELELGDVQTTALIPLAIKANETLRPNARIQAPTPISVPAPTPPRKSLT